LPATFSAAVPAIEIADPVTVSSKMVPLRFIGRIGARLGRRGCRRTNFRKISQCRRLVAPQRTIEVGQRETLRASTVERADNGSRIRHLRAKPGKFFVHIYAAMPSS
jgi:hypothetical protein